MALLYAAIANGGKLWLPQIVERVESPDGQTLEEFAPRVRREISVAPETLAIVRQALVGVVNESKGTAYKSRAKDIEVAGKTGTAQVHGRNDRARRLRGGRPRLVRRLRAGGAPEDRHRGAGRARRPRRRRRGAGGDGDHPQLLRERGPRRQGRAARRAARAADHNVVEAPRDAAALRARRRR